MKDDDGWIEWHGGECPVPDGTPVHYRLRNGLLGLGADPADVDWRHMGAADDVVRYRISKPAEPPAPDTSAEDALWHEYAQAVLGVFVQFGPIAEVAARGAAAVADAMLAEAKKRGRV